MAYILDSTTIKAPNTMDVKNSTQTVQVRALDGSIRRDQFGDNKRVWTLEYNNLPKAYFDTLQTIYTSYLANGIKTWQITETNYTVSQTNVHVDLLERGFRVGGEDYLSDITLTLTEA